MANVLRRLGFKKSEPRDSDARQKLQKELFAFSQCAEHGFPHKPSALAYDPKLKLVAIGSRDGAIRVFGRPGVEYSAEHRTEVEVNRIFFLPEQARLVSLCNDNSLHLWEINTKDGEGVLEEKRSFTMEASKLKSITACCLTSNAEQLFIGTEGGNIHILSLPDFKASENIIYQDVVMQNVPDDFKVNPGPVEDIAQHPSKPEKFLIGYNRGLMVLWDNSESQAISTFNAAQQLESVGWHRDGTQFMSAHADGSHIVWSTLDPTKPKEQATTPYGPFPCKAINKIQWKTAKSEPFILFSGGMPRASYGDRHTVSVMQGSSHSVFDFSSKVLDFVTICSADELEDYDKFDYDDPHSLLVLTEEEVVAVDLQTDGWPAFKLPYLNSLHSSAITCVSHVTNVPDSLWNKISDAGEAQFTEASARDWPITGGQTLPQAVASKDLLLTGHEDGSIRFWDVSTVAQRLIYTLKTGAIFGADVGATENAEDEEWPPFKKVGTFDPYSDDPRLGIQKINLCALSETLVVAGTAGQVVILQFEREDRTLELKSTNINIVSDRDGFVWKGHEALPVQGGEMKFEPGFQPLCVMQACPPAACTALTVQSEIQLVAMGTAHGVAVFDYNQRVEVTTKCTLNPADLTGTADSAMSRRKSFKKSLRESFRRLRRGRSGRKQKPQASPKQSPKPSPKKTAEDKSEGIEVKSEEQKTEEGAATATEGGASAAAATDPATVESTKPVERAVEARTEKSATEDMASMVRCLYFAETFLINAQSHAPTLWVGTNGGAVFIYQITIPANDKRDAEPVKCQLGKEIQLKHRAPVINISVVDSNWQPLPAPLEVQHERAKAPDMTGGHHVVICSEEQFKVFDLPSLKAKAHKYKLTATEGAKVRRVGFVNFRSKSDERYHENDLAILTNQGDVQVFTVPNFKRQLRAECVRKENVSYPVKPAEQEFQPETTQTGTTTAQDEEPSPKSVSGIVSSVFTLLGEGFFLLSPSEFQRFSVSARIATKPACEVLLKDGVRPPLPEVEKKPQQQATQPEEEPFVEIQAPAPEQEAGAAPEAAATEEAAQAEAAPVASEGAESEPVVTEEGEKKEEEPSEEQAKADEALTSDLTMAGSAMDQSSLTEGANDSLAVADTTGDITVDSVKVHLSESRVEESSSSSSTTQVISSERSMVTRTVVSKTVVSETTGDGTVTKESTTVTQMSSGSSSGPAIEFSSSGGGRGGGGDAASSSGGGGGGGGDGGGGAGDNLEDDAKLPASQVADEMTEECGETLEELHISEDEAQHLDSPVQSPVCTPVVVDTDPIDAPVSQDVTDNENSIGISLCSNENNNPVEDVHQTARPEISDTLESVPENNNQVEEESLTLNQIEDTIIKGEDTVINYNTPEVEVAREKSPEEVEEEMIHAEFKDRQLSLMEDLDKPLLHEFIPTDQQAPSSDDAVCQENDPKTAESLPAIDAEDGNASAEQGEDQESLQQFSGMEKLANDLVSEAFNSVNFNLPSLELEKGDQQLPEEVNEGLIEPKYTKDRAECALSTLDELEEDVNTDIEVTEDYTESALSEVPSADTQSEVPSADTQSEVAGNVDAQDAEKPLNEAKQADESTQPTAPLSDTDSVQVLQADHVTEEQPMDEVIEVQSADRDQTEEAEAGIAQPTAPLANSQEVEPDEPSSDNARESQWISEEDLVSQPGRVTPPEEEDRTPSLGGGGGGGGMMIPSIEIMSSEEGEYYTESTSVNQDEAQGGEEKAAAAGNMERVPEASKGNIGDTDEKEEVGGDDGKEGLEERNFGEKAENHSDSK